MIHEGQLHSEFRSDDVWAECSCAWRGPTRTDDDQAALDLSEHYAEMNPATP